MEEDGGQKRGQGFVYIDDYVVWKLSCDDIDKYDDDNGRRQRPNDAVKVTVSEVFALYTYYAEVRALVTCYGLRCAVLFHLSLVYRGFKVEAGPGPVSR